MGPGPNVRSWHTRRCTAVLECSRGRARLGSWQGRCDNRTIRRRPPHFQPRCCTLCYSRRFRRLRARARFPRADDLAFRIAVPRVVLSPEPLAPARDVATGESLACDAVARNVHRADVQPAIRAIWSPLPGPVRLEARRRRRVFPGARAVPAVEPGACSALSIARRVVMVELCSDRGPLRRARFSRCRSDSRDSWARKLLTSTGWAKGSVPASWTNSEPTPTLASLLVDGSDAAIANAHSHGYRQGAIAEHLGVSRWHVGRRLAQVAAHAQLGPGPN